MNNQDPERTQALLNERVHASLVRINEEVNNRIFLALLPVIAMLVWQAKEQVVSYVITLFCFYFAGVILSYVISLNKDYHHTAAYHFRWFVNIFSQGS